MALDKIYAETFTKTYTDNYGTDYQELPIADKVFMLGFLTNPAHRCNPKVDGTPFSVFELIGEYEQLCAELLRQRDFLLNVAVSASIPLNRLEEFELLAKDYRKEGLSNSLVAQDTGSDK